MIQIAFSIKAYPGASRNQVDGLVEDVEGNQYLKVKTTKPAESGKANKDIIDIISKTYKIPKSRILFTKGGKSRFKKLIIEFEYESEIPVALKSVIC